MISVRGTLNRTVGAWARVPGAVSASPDIAGQQVYQVKGATEVDDYWERRIVQMGDGRSVAAIIEILYHEELRAGAWQADIGLWKSLFDRSVEDTIRALAFKGRVCLKSVEGGKGELR